MPSHSPTAKIDHVIDHVVAGFDWDDAEHVACLLEPDGGSRIDLLRQSPRRSRDGRPGCNAGIRCWKTRIPLR